MTITTHLVVNASEGFDHLYIFGADIADPYNDPNVTWDGSLDPEQPAYVLVIESSEDAQPYLDALADHGLSVVGNDELGQWILEQSRAL
jgi:hypothetical protein